MTITRNPDRQERLREPAANGDFASVATPARWLIGEALAERDQNHAIARPRFAHASARLAVLWLAIPLGFSGALATPEKDEAWKKLIAEARRHGGVETIYRDTGSYVFVAPDGMNITFTRTLDDKLRFVCAIFMSANIETCMNWDSEKLVYGVRAGEGAPWISSDVPPDVAEDAPEAPLWLDLVSAFFDEDVPFSIFHGWRKGGDENFAKKAFRHGFGARLFRRLR